MKNEKNKSSKKSKQKTLNDFSRRLVKRTATVFAAESIEKAQQK
jgi:hypothetical protein